MDDSKIIESRKYRIYPTEEQKEQIIFNINANREVWNHMLAYCYKPVMELDRIKNTPDKGKTKELYKYINGYVELIDNSTTKSKKIYSFKKLKSIIKKEKFEVINKFEEKNKFEFDEFTVAKHGLVYEEQKEIFKRLGGIKPKQVQNEYPRLRNGDSASYDYIKQNALKTAFQTHFNPAFKKADMPKFRSYRDTLYSGSYSTKAGNNSFIRDNGDLKLSGFSKLKPSDIKIINHYPINGRLFKVTITRTPTDKYYASLFYYVSKHTRHYEETGKSVGLDLNTAKQGFVKNDDDKFLPPNVDRLEESLRREKAKLSKRLYNANKVIAQRKHEQKIDPLVHVPSLLEFGRYQKQRKKVASIYEKITRRRNYWVKKVSSELIRDYDLIAIEDLDVKGMLKAPHGKGAGRHHRLAKLISDSNFSKFRRELEYKAEWNDKKVVAIDRYFASSQVCHKCGHPNEDIGGEEGLSIREWECPECHEYHIRDINAAKNILNKALEEIIS